MTRENLDTCTSYMNILFKKPNATCSLGCNASVVQLQNFQSQGLAGSFWGVPVNLISLKAVFDL